MSYQNIMESFNFGFSNGMLLVGVFMCRLIRNTADQPIDLLIYYQNPAFQKNDDPLGFAQGTQLSSLKNAGIVMPADFWQNIEQLGVADYAFLAYNAHFQLQVFAADDNYLLNVYRISVEPLVTKSQNLTIHTAATELENTQKQLWLANERLKMVSRAGKIGIWDFNSATNTFSWDDETCVIHGVLPGSKVTMDDFLQLVHPEDTSYLLNKIAMQETDLDVIRIVRPDGSIRFVKSSSMLLAAHEGIPFDMIGIVADVTETGLSSLALSESEKRYRFLVNNLKEVIFQTDLQFNLLFLSSYWIELTGFEIDELIGNNPFDYIHPEDREMCRQKFEKLLEHSIDHSLLEIRCRHKTDNYKWVEVFTKLTYDENKRPNGTIGTLYDISERKKMEMELANSEKRFRAIFNSAFQFMGLTDIHGRLLEANRTFLESKGVTLKEIVGSYFWDIGGGFKDISVETLLKELFHQAAEGESLRHELEICDKNKNRIAIDFSIKPINDEEGKTILLLTEGYDISDKKRAQAAIIESEQRFRDIAENVDEVFWIRDLNSPRFIYINSTYERITGKTPQSLYENPFSFLDFVLAEDRQMIAGLLQMNVEEDTGMQFRVINKKGELRWFTGRIFVVKDDSGIIRRRIGLARDITEQKEKERLLTETLEKEKELNKMKSQFVSFVSHEFRTPLTTIQSGVELMEYYLFNAPGSRIAMEYAPKIRHHIEVIHNKIAMITELLTDTLTLNQIEAGKISFHPQSVNLVGFLQNMLTEFFHDRPDRRIVETVITGIPVMVSLDEKLLKRAVINLLSNAFKFSSENPSLRLLFEERQIKIEVIDRGIGIPEEDIPKLFSAFFRAGNAGKVPGTGLGLQIARQLIELHGGKIHLTSQLGRGTSVNILIPLP